MLRHLRGAVEFADAGQARGIAIPQAANRIVNNRLGGWIEPVFGAVATDIRIYSNLDRI